ncbi:hypothetical protein [Methanospirillum sp.]
MALEKAGPIFILWKLPDGIMYQCFIIECKIVYNARDVTTNKGLTTFTELPLHYQSIKS